MHEKYTFEIACRTIASFFTPLEVNIVAKKKKSEVQNASNGMHLFYDQIFNKSCSLNRRKRKACWKKIKIFNFPTGATKKMLEDLIEEETIISLQKAILIFNYFVIKDKSLREEDQIFFLEDIEKIFDLFLKKIVLKIKKMESLENLEKNEIKEWVEIVDNFPEYFDALVRYGKLRSEKAHSLLAHQKIISFCFSFGEVFIKINNSTYAKLAYQLVFFMQEQLKSQSNEEQNLVKKCINIVPLELGLNSRRLRAAHDNFLQKEEKVSFSFVDDLSDEIEKLIEILAKDKEQLNINVALQQYTNILYFLTYKEISDKEKVLFLRLSLKLYSKLSQEPVKDPLMIRYCCKYVDSIYRLVQKPVAPPKMNRVEKNIEIGEKEKNKIDQTDWEYFIEIWEEKSKFHEDIQPGEYIWIEFFSDWFKAAVILESVAKREEALRNFSTKYEGVLTQNISAFFEITTFYVEKRLKIYEEEGTQIALQKWAGLFQGTYFYFLENKSKIADGLYTGFKKFSKLFTDQNTDWSLMNPHLELYKGIITELTKYYASLGKQQEVEEKENKRRRKKQAKKKQERQARQKKISGGSLGPKNPQQGIPQQSIIDDVESDEEDVLPEKAQEDKGKEEDKGKKESKKTKAWRKGNQTGAVKTELYVPSSASSIESFLRVSTEKALEAARQKAAEGKQRNAYSKYILKGYPPIKIPPDIVTFLERIEEQGGCALIVGGAVRDFLWWKKKCRDIDIVVGDCEAAVLIENFKEIFGKTLEKKNKIDVVQLYSWGKFEITLKLGKFCLLEDAKSRDYKCNAIYLTSKGERCDPLQYCEQMRNSEYIESIGNPVDKFREDPVRILRGVYLQTDSGWVLSPKVVDAIYQKSYCFSIADMGILKHYLCKLLLNGNGERNFEVMEKFEILFPLLFHFFSFVGSFGKFKKCWEDNEILKLFIKSKLKNHDEEYQKQEEKQEEKQEDFLEIKDLKILLLLPVVWNEEKIPVYYSQDKLKKYIDEFKIFEMKIKPVHLQVSPHFDLSRDQSRKGRGRAQQPCARGRDQRSIKIS